MYVYSYILTDFNNKEYRMKKLYIVIIMIMVIGFSWFKDYKEDSGFSNHDSLVVVESATEITNKVDSNNKFSVSEFDEQSDKPEHEPDANNMDDYVYCDGPCERSEDDWVNDYKSIITDGSEELEDGTFSDGNLRYESEETLRTKYKIYDALKNNLKDAKSIRDYADEAFEICSSSGEKNIVNDIVIGTTTFDEGCPKNMTIETDEELYISLMSKNPLARFGELEKKGITPEMQVYFLVESRNLRARLRNGDDTFEIMTSFKETLEGYGFSDEQIELLIE